MLAAATYDAVAWRDFYVMFGGAAAALTGLVFVGLSIHRRAIVASPFLRARARYLTGGLTAVPPSPPRRCSGSSPGSASSSGTAAGSTCSCPA